MGSNEGVVHERKAYAQPRLRNNVAWSFAGNAVYAVSQWSILIACARISGNPLAVGQLALAFAVAAPVIQLASLNLRVILSTDANRVEPYGKFLTLRVVSVCMALIAVFIISMVGDYDYQTVGAIVLIGVAKCAESTSDIAFGLLQRDERMAIISKSLMSRGLATLALVVVTLVLGGNIVAVCAVIAAAWCAHMVLVDLPSARRVADVPVQLCREWRAMRDLAIKALPLGLAGSLSAFSVMLPRYYIEANNGLVDLGLFAGASQLMMIGIYVINAIGQAARPRLSLYHHSGNSRAFTRLLLQLCGMGAATGIIAVGVAVAIGGSVLGVVYGPAFMGAHGVLIVLAVAAAISFAFVFCGTGLVAMHNYRAQFVGQVIGFGGALFVCVAAIPVYGIVGAAYAILVKALLESVYTVVVLVMAMAAIREKSDDHSSTTPCAR